MPDQEFDLISFEIGVKDRLTLRSALRAASELKRLMEITAPAPILVSIGGYDTDPRELIDIPEAMQYLRDVANALRLLDCWEPLKARAVETVRPILLLAGGEIERGQIRVEGN